MKELRNNLAIELHVSDFDQAKVFYAQFGFEELSRDPISDKELGYLVLQRSDALGRTLLNFYGGDKRVFQHAHFKDFSSETPRGYAVEITVPVSDVEALWKSLEHKLPADVVAQPLALKRWGQKDFRVTDPFGFYIRFTKMVDWGQ